MKSFPARRVFRVDVTFRLGHVRGGRMSRVWRSSMFLEHSIRKVRGSTLVPAGAPLHNTITTIGQYGQSQSGIGARRAA
jgi:hypothetical protein